VKEDVDSGVAMVHQKSNFPPPPKKNYRERRETAVVVACIEY